MKNLSILMAIFAMMFAFSTSNVLAKGKPSDKCHPKDLQCLCDNNPDLCIIEVDPPIETVPECNYSPDVFCL